MEKNKRIEEMARRANEMQALYESVERNNRALEGTLAQLDSMSGEILRLLDYYMGPWIDERDELAGHPSRDHLMFAEDPIYDEVQAWDSLLEQLHKKAGELLERFRKPRTK